MRLLGMRLRRAWRRAVDEAFILLVLGPIIVLPSWWIGERYLELARGLAHDVVAARPLAVMAALGTLLALSAWPGARREAAGDVFLAPQPVPAGARGVAAALATAGRALLPALVLLAALLVLADEGRFGPLLLDGGTNLALTAGVLAASSIAAAWLALLVALGVGRLGPTRRDAVLPRFMRARRPDGPVRALLRRDVRLVLRGGPATGVAALVAAVCLLAATATLLDPRLVDAANADLLRRRLVVGFAALGCLAAAAITPFLAGHQLPRLWLERAAGMPLAAPARAKALLAVILAAVPAALGLLLVAALPVDPLLRLAAAGQLLLAWLFLGSTLGLAVYEIPEEPLLGLLFAGLVASALTALVLFVPNVWWLWTLGWGWLVGQLAERSTQRLMMLEVAR